MLELGWKMGRQKAHDVVYEAAQRPVNERKPFSQTLQEEPEVASQLTKEEILRLLDPEEYTGLCSYFAEAFALKAEQKSKELIGN